MGVVLSVLAVVVGVLIGMVGVGGVLLPPGLVALGDLTANEATATSTWAFVFTGVVGTIAYAWRGVVPWGMFARLAVGVVPAAFLGALVNATLPASVVLLGLGALTLFVGVQQLRPRTVRETRDTGYGGSGRGRRLCRVRVRTDRDRRAGAARAGPADAGDSPVASGRGEPGGAATRGRRRLDRVPADRPDRLSLGTALGCFAALGVVAGAVVATRINAEGLRRIVAMACLAAGVFLVVRAVV